jgi:hypothetical protein
VAYVDYNLRTVDGGRLAGSFTNVLVLAGLFPILGYIATALGLIGGDVDGDGGWRSYLKISDEDGGMSGRQVSRRAVLAAGAAAGGAAGLAAALGSGGSDGTVFGGIMALNEAYNVCGDLWIGPDSAKDDVAAESGRVYMASDTQVEYYGDGGSWVKMGVGSQSEPVPSVKTDEIGIGPGHEHATPENGTKGIQQAINALPDDGGLVTLSTGDYVINNGAQYPGSAIIHGKDNVALVGQGRQTIIRTPDGYTAHGEGQKVIDFGGVSTDVGNDDYPGFSSETYVQGGLISNLAIDGNRHNQTPIQDDTSTSGAKYDGHNIEITGFDCHVRNIWSYGSTGDGVELTSHSDPAQATRNSVIGCTFRDNWEHCVHVHGSADTLVVGNVMDGDENNGVLSLSAGGVTYSNVIILGNIIRNGKEFGVDLSSGRNNAGSANYLLFAYNIVADNATDGVRIREESNRDVWVTNNVIFGNGKQGIHFYAGRRVHIYDNDVVKNGEHGIWLTQSIDGTNDRPLRDIYVKDNWVYENNQNDGVKFGIFVQTWDEPAERVRITGNDVVSDGTTPFNHTSAIQWIEYGSPTYADLVIRRNFVSGSDRSDEISIDAPALRLENDGADDFVSYVPVVGDHYLDDGTNTGSGTRGKRVYDGSAWVDAWTV